MNTRMIMISAVVAITMATSVDGMSPGAGREMATVSRLVVKAAFKKMKQLYQWHKHQLLKIKQGNKPKKNQRTKH